jgi:hypothetical protein
MNAGKLRVPGTSLHTKAIGAVVVHRITLGGVLRLARKFPPVDGNGDALDANAVADAVLREVCRGQRVDGTAYSERELTQEDLASLTPDERSAAIRAVCEAEGWDPSGLPPDELLVRGLRAETRTVRERERAASDEARTAAAVADSVLSRETMAKLMQSAAQIEAIKASLELPDWLDQMKARQRLYDPQPFAGHTASSVSRPEIRSKETALQDATTDALFAANQLHSRKLDGLAEAQRLALQSQTDINSTVLATARELAVRARAWERRATLGYGIAIAAVGLAVLVALAQVIMAIHFKDAADRWQSSLEGTISEQRNELRALRDQNESLRAQIESEQAALRDLSKKSVAPAAAPPAAAVPVHQGTKPAPLPKRSTKAGH